MTKHWCSALIYTWIKRNYLACHDNILYKLELNTNKPLGLINCELVLDINWTSKISTFLQIIFYWVTYLNVPNIGASGSLWNFRNFCTYSWQLCHRQYSEHRLRTPNESFFSNTYPKYFDQWGRLAKYLRWGILGYFG